MTSRLTPQIFIVRAQKIHGDRYDYSEIDYVHSQKKVPIICNTHGEYFQSPQKHLSGQGCPECGYIKTAQKKRLPLEKFISKANSIHHNKYGYDKVNYINSGTKIIITCPEHGDFEMTPGNHTHKTSPQGCQTCNGKKRWTRQSFIQESNRNHFNKYSYFKVKFENVNKSVIIICPEHGNFYQKPSKHLIGQGCPVCAGTKKGTLEQFVEKAKSIWGDKYNYDKTVYSSNHKKVTITCLIHGDFSITPANHTHKSYPQGCKKCSGKKVLNTTDFIGVVNEIHDGLYNYSLTQYTNSQTPVKIICPYHGEFLQKPNVHLKGSGCSKCRLPRGEYEIEKELKKLNVEYENQYSFKDCRWKHPLPFDFRVEVNGKIGLIEFHGMQHYSTINKFFDLELIQKRDQIKKKYCEQNCIPLLVISYEEYSNISNKVQDFVNALK